MACGTHRHLAIRHTIETHHMLIAPSPPPSRPSHAFMYEACPSVCTTLPCLFAHVCLDTPFWFVRTCLVDHLLAVTGVLVELIAGSEAFCMSAQQLHQAVWRTDMCNTLYPYPTHCCHKHTCAVPPVFFSSHSLHSHPPRSLLLPLTNTRPVASSVVS